MPLVACGWRVLASAIKQCNPLLPPAAAARLVMAPVARAVWRQEAREGDLRFAHLRLREYAAEAAQYGAGKAEGRELGRALGAAVENQVRRCSTGRSKRSWNACGLACVLRCKGSIGRRSRTRCGAVAAAQGFGRLQLPSPLKEGSETGRSGGACR